MKKYLKVLLYLGSFIIILILAIVGYQFLTKNYSPEQNQIKQDEIKEKPSFPKAKDFVMENSKGEEVYLSNFLGKPIIVNFWATWCGPCKTELPAFEEAYQKYGKEIEFLMVNLTDEYNDTVEKVKEFVKQNQYEFPLYFDTKYQATNTYYLYAVPQTLVINQEGNIVKQYKGMINQQILEKHCRELIEN